MEFASVVTDGDLNIIKEGPEFVVHISDADLGGYYFIGSVHVYIRCYGRVVYENAQSNRADWKVSL